MAGSDHPVIAEAETTSQGKAPGKSAKLSGALAGAGTEQDCGTVAARDRAEKFALALL